MTDSKEYGAWPSPLSAHDVVGAATTRMAPLVDGDTIWWQEARPEDEGRITLMRRTGEEDPLRVSPPGANVRTRFHEYGGGAVSVSKGLSLYVEFDDQRVYRVDVGADAAEAGPRPITPDGDGLVRYSCFRIDHGRGVAFCLREDQREASVEPVTSLVRIDLDGPNADFGVEVVPGRRRPREVDAELPADVDSPPDFVCDPVLSPDGRRIAWLSWNHPRMAWDGSWLWLADLDDAGDASAPRLLAGADDEAIEQPRWVGEDRLVLLSDRTGWSNLHTLDLSDGRRTPLLPEDRDFGLPRWVPDLASYDVLPDGRIASLRFADGWCGLCVVAPDTGRAALVDSDLSSATDVRTVDEDHVVCRAWFVDRPADVVVVDLRDGSTRSVAAAPEAPDPAWVSRPESVSWLSEDGATAHGFLYDPVNPDVAAPDGALPPLLVTLHGGPTAAATPAYVDARAYWTSRGFAVLDVNYAGSSGFGRGYRQRLRGQWGVAEVADVASAARHLAAEGRIDGARTAITGGSAGGYTALAALTSSDAFAAGASHFGVSDLAALGRDTHKLESRYLWDLVAPWPEGRAVYAARSPIHHVEDLATPLILLQGTDDRVVPPDQAELLAGALRARGMPVALVLFEGEGHGFRDPANRARAMELELSFYAQVFGFTPAGDIERVEVENLPA